MYLSFIQNTSESIAIPGTPLEKVLVLISVIILGSILHWAYHKWIVPPDEKKTEEYIKNKYKDIDAC